MERAKSHKMQEYWEKKYPKVEYSAKKPHTKAHVALQFTIACHNLALTPKAQSQAISSIHF